MNENLFQIALRNKEIGDFFRGNGRYKVQSQDYEGHVHGANMGGAANVFCDLSLENSKIFDRAFEDFIKSLDVSKEDFSHFLANISSYAAQKSRGSFLNSRLFESNKTIASKLVREYIKKIDSSPFGKDVAAQFNRHLKFTTSKGLNLLNDSIVDLSNLTQP